jgi:hypothetical protein
MQTNNTFRVISGTASLVPRSQIGKLSLKCYNAALHLKIPLSDRESTAVFARARSACFERARVMGCILFGLVDPMRVIRVIICLGTLVSAVPTLAADPAKPDSQASGNILMIQAAPTVFHFHSRPEYTGHPWLVGAEWQHPSHWLGGYSYFNNSFDQKCHYLYAGYWWRISEKDPNWYVKLTGGVIAGYKKPYEDKIPFNHNGVAPGIVPGVGYKLNRFNAQLNLLGSSGVMVTIGYDLDLAR